MEDAKCSDNTTALTFSPPKNGMFERTLLELQVIKRVDSNAVNDAQKNTTDRSILHVT